MYLENVILIVLKLFIFIFLTVNRIQSKLKVIITLNFIYK